MVACIASLLQHLFPWPSCCSIIRGKRYGFCNFNVFKGKKNLLFEYVCTESTVCLCLYQSRALKWSAVTEVLQEHETCFPLDEEGNGEQFPSFKGD